MQKRKNYSANFKCKVVIEAIKGELTFSEIAAKYSVHTSQIAAWKKLALAKLPAVFSNKSIITDKHSAKEINSLHAKIGQLLVEKDFLLKAFDHQ